MRAAPSRAPGRLPSRVVVPLLVLGASVACRRTNRQPEEPRTPEVPAAAIPAEEIERTLHDSRARQASAVQSGDLDLLERRFRRMNLVAMGRDPDGGRPIHMVRDESPEFRQLARVLRDQLGDEAVDVRGERIAERGLAALLDERERFRFPLSADAFLGESPGEAALEVLGWTRDLPLILLHHGFVLPDNRSRLPAFTLRTLLHARWNVETGRAPEHAFSPAEKMAWLEFRGRWKTWSPVGERRIALEELARLLPSYPLRAALEALVRAPPTGPFVIIEEGQ